MIHYNICPVCDSVEIHPQLSATDHTVSHENFAIWQCDACTARFTQDVPGKADIGKYYQSDTYISHSDTKKGLVNRLYHIVRNQTLASKKRLLIKETGLLKASLLDIGSGTGAFINHMRSNGWAVVGLEPDEAAREKARELYDLEAAPIESLFSQQAASFNAITMWHVLEHVHDLHPYIDQLKKLLAPGGRIFIAVPNYTSGDAKHYGRSWAAYDVPRHLYHFSPESMTHLLEAHGLQLMSCKPMWFDSYYVSMLSEKYKNGKGNLLKACWHGLRSNMKAWGDKTRCSSVIYVIRNK